MERVMVIQIARLGDLVQTLPLIHALKSVPGRELTLVIDRRVESGLKGAVPVDNLIALNLVKMGEIIQAEGILRAFNDFSDLLQPLRRVTYGRLYNLNHSPLNAALISQVKAKEVTGFIPQGGTGDFTFSPPLRILFNQGHNRRWARMHLADLFRWLADVHNVPQPPFWKATDSALKYADDVMGNLREDGFGKVCALHLGAGAEIRKWGAEKFARTVEILRNRGSYGFVVIGKERDEAAEFMNMFANRSGILNLTGKTDIENLAGVLARVDLMIGADSGPLQLAAAVGAKTVGIFFASALCHETGPLGSGHLIIQAVPPCAPCNEELPDCENYYCRDLIKPELVADLIEKVLSGEEDDLENIQLPADVSLFRSEVDSMGQFYRRVGADAGDDEAAFYRELWFKLAEQNGDYGSLKPMETGAEDIITIEQEVRRLAENPVLLPLAEYYFLTKADEGPVSAAKEFKRAKRKLAELGGAIEDEFYSYY